MKTKKIFGALIMGDAPDDDVRCVHNQGSLEYDKSNEKFMLKLVTERDLNIRLDNLYNGVEDEFKARYTPWAIFMSHCLHLNIDFMLFTWPHLKRYI